MNKNMYKKGKNANKTVRYKKKRNNNHKNTQKKMVEIGGEGMNKIMNKVMNKVMKGGAVCDDLSTINQSNLLDIFKYNIQVPKLVIPHIFEIVIDELATGVPGSSPDASSSKSSGKSSSKSSSKSSGKSKSSSSKNVNFSDAKKQLFEQQLMYDSIAKDGNCFFAAIASQLNEIYIGHIFPGFKLTIEITQQDIRNAIGIYYRLPDNYKVLQEQARENALFFGNVSDKNVDADTYIKGIEGNQWGAEKEMSAIEDGALNALTDNRQIGVYIYGIRDGRLYNTGFGSLLNQATRKNSIPIIFFYNDKGSGSGGNHYDRLYFDAADANKTLKLYQDFIKNAKPSEAKIVEPSEDNIKQIIDIFPDISRDKIITLLQDNGNDVTRVSNILLSRS